MTAVAAVAATERSAVLSDCGRYRYRLGRTWDRDDHGLGTVTWVMLNPSTADANKDDATIRRCTAFSKAWGYNELLVVNLQVYPAAGTHVITVKGHRGGSRG